MSKEKTKTVANPVGANCVRPHFEGKTQKGITLIALIITIIVMLILVGVSVTVALNGGLFKTAQEAKENTATKRNEELQLSDGKVEINDELYNSIDEYVNGGDSNEPVGYAAYVVGNPVEVNGEEFYVLKDSGSSESIVTLLAKDCIDTATLEQSASASTAVFSTESYWGSGTSPYDIKEETTPIPDSHTAAKAAYDYGVKLGGTGRLMTYSEATALQTANSDILYGTNGKSSSTNLSYWLSSASNADYVYLVSDSNLVSRAFNPPGNFCKVRPVVEISKSNIS